MTAMHANRLIHEKSPYLLQHAHNPVDWYPWGEEAFRAAATSDRPIFLSIGYSTCHWCHVMERESFSNAEVAELMNDHFVSIKVDREERPDLDHIYMTVCQMITGSGGWPLTVIMTPDRKPFFAGTYIPRQSRSGQIGMLDFIPRIGQLWKSKRNDLIRNAENITSTLLKISTGSQGREPDEKLLDRTYEELRDRYDTRNGGFGDAPKFPIPHTLSFLLRYWKRSSIPGALQMAEHTLQAMRRGGIYDHVGYGFHRYATDPQWLVPHFEKMLYDQALLSMAYTEAYQAAGNSAYRETAQEILAYTLRDLRSPEGGFYCADDAESEGEEGKFYLWTENEIHQALGPETAECFSRVFHVRAKGNFADETSGKTTGANILYATSDPGKDGEGQTLRRDRLKAAMKTLYGIREKRTHPRRDDKILTDWNGLMIAALAKASRVFRDKAYLAEAESSASFILKRLRSPEGFLLHRYRQGVAGIAALLDDYAFLIWGLLEIYETGFETFYLKTALELNGDLMRHFWDPGAGGFFFTPDQDAEILVRRKEIYDGAVPSGNSVAMLNLLRLARITGKTELEEKAAGIARAFSTQVEQMPSAHAQFMVALDFLVGPSFEVVIAGRKDSEDTRGMIEALQSRFLPNKVILLRQTDQLEADIIRYAPFTRDMKPLAGKATAYVCTARTCREPVTGVREMLEQLK